MKSEIKIWFTLFEKWKVKDKSLSLFPRSEKWTENLVHSFREWKVKWKCLEIEIEKWNFSRILEKFFRIKKILRFRSRCFSFCKLLLWNVEKGETCEKSWVSNVWVTFNCIAISGITYQILISDFRFGKASFSSENLTLIYYKSRKKNSLSSQSDGSIKKECIELKVVMYIHRGKNSLYDDRTAHKCDQADYTSYQASDLRRNLKTHSGEK